MRVIFCLTIFLSTSLAACQMPGASRSSSTGSPAMQTEADKSQCRAFGFKEGTTEFSNCLLQMFQNRSSLSTQQRMLECQRVRAEERNRSGGGFMGGLASQTAINNACRGL